MVENVKILLKGLKP